MSSVKMTGDTETGVRMSSVTVGVLASERTVSPLPDIDTRWPLYRLREKPLAY